MAAFVSLLAQNCSEKLCQENQSAGKDAFMENSGSFAHFSRAFSKYIGIGDYNHSSYCSTKRQGLQISLVSD